MGRVMAKPRPPRNRENSSYRAKTPYYKLDKKTGKPVKSRHPYFKYYRIERGAISILENTFSKNFNKAEYRANRLLYYVILPKLLRKLSGYRPDLIRLLFLEESLYEQLLSYKFCRFERHRTIFGPMPVHGRKPNRIPIVFKCYNDC